MSEPIRITLSPSHISQFRELDQQEAACKAKMAEITARRELIAQTIAGMMLDPDHPVWNGGHLDIMPTELVVSVPTPALVEDDGN